MNLVKEIETAQSADNKKYIFLLPQILFLGPTSFPGACGGSMAPGDALIADF